MHISRVIVQNYRCLQNVDVTLNPDMNIIVGNNECGKSTLLEAIYLALTGQLNGRPISLELHPYLFNNKAVADYIAGLSKFRSVGSSKRKAGSSKTTVASPPQILIELYFSEDPEFLRLKGNNNRLRQNSPGIALSIEFNREYTEELQDYISDPSIIRTIPIEYYTVIWRGFDDNLVTSRSIPIKPALIDASTIRNNAAASRYVIDILRDSLSSSQKVDLALSYRMMRGAFMDSTKVKAVNTALEGVKGTISEKSLSVSLDMSSRATWEAGLSPYLDDVPLTLVGKGEQNSIKMKLAMESNAASHLVLIEEPENHLSFSNLNTLIGHIGDHRGSRQLIITTHSNFVLNKLGLKSVVLLHDNRFFRLDNLSNDTHEYFLRLPGYDTLRLILAKRAILVEGASDELIVQAAFLRKLGRMPIQLGVDVIAVRSLAFERFLEIASILNIDVTVVTDNDGDVSRVDAKYAKYRDNANIKISYDKDEKFKTLESQMVKANGKDVVEKVLGQTFPDELSTIEHMIKRGNKTPVALMFFNSKESWNVPGYINEVVY